MTESFQNLYDQLDHRKREELAKRARIDTSLLYSAAQSMACAGWIHTRIAEALARPRPELFPGRYDAANKRIKRPVSFARTTA